MAGLQFGFSLDPQDAPQRHCFYDSEEEEELENSVPEDVFSVELVDKLAIKLLIIGNTQAASSFLSSHVITESEPCAVVKTRYPLKVIKGKYFTRDGEQAVSNDATVSKIYRDVKNGGTCLCLNERIFKEEYCNYWSKTVSVLFIVVYHYCCLLLLFILDYRPSQTAVCGFSPFTSSPLLLEFRIEFR